MRIENINKYSVLNMYMLNVHTTCCVSMRHKKSDFNVAGTNIYYIKEYLLRPSHIVECPGLTLKLNLHPYHVELLAVGIDTRCPRSRRAQRPTHLPSQGAMGSENGGLPQHLLPL